MGWCDREIERTRVAPQPHGVFDGYFEALAQDAFGALNYDPVRTVHCVAAGAPSLGLGHVLQGATPAMGVRRRGSTASPACPASCCWCRHGAQRIDYDTAGPRSKREPSIGIVTSRRTHNTGRPPVTYSGTRHHEPDTNHRAR